jgi:hypothetical protein
MTFLRYPGGEYGRRFRPRCSEPGCGRAGTHLCDVRLASRGVCDRHSCKWYSYRTGRSSHACLEQSGKRGGGKITGIKKTKKYPRRPSPNDPAGTASLYWFDVERLDERLDNLDRGTILRA